MDYLKFGQKKHLGMSEIYSSIIVITFLYYTYR